MKPTYLFWGIIVVLMMIWIFSALIISGKQFEKENEEAKKNLRKIQDEETNKQIKSLEELGREYREAVDDYKEAVYSLRNLEDEYQNLLFQHKRALEANEMLKKKYNSLKEKYASLRKK